MACSDGVPEICSDTTPVNRKVRRLNSGVLFRVGASAREVKCRKTAGEVKIMCLHIISAGGKKKNKSGGDDVCRAAALSNFFYCHLPHKNFSNNATAAAD